MGSSGLGHEATLIKSLAVDPVQDKQRRLRHAQSGALPNMVNAGTIGHLGAAVLPPAVVVTSREREKELRWRARTVTAKPFKNDDAVRMHVLPTARWAIGASGVSAA